MMAICPLCEKSANLLYGSNPTEEWYRCPLCGERSSVESVMDFKKRLDEQCPVEHYVIQKSWYDPTGAPQSRFIAKNFKSVVDVQDEARNMTEKEHVMTRVFQYLIVPICEYRPQEQKV